MGCRSMRILPGITNTGMDWILLQKPINIILNRLISLQSFILIENLAFMLIWVLMGAYGLARVILIRTRPGMLKGNWVRSQDGPGRDRKSTRLNSVTNAHLVCRLLLEKKKHTHKTRQAPVI